MISNAVVIVGVILTLINEYACLITGKILQGLAVGSFSLYCPKFIAETAPIEIKGPSGALPQVCITFGILVAFVIGFGLGDVDQDDYDSFQIQYYWYIIFAIPLLISLIQVLLLVTIYSYDTPSFLKQNGKTEELKVLMNKIYKDPAVAE